MFTLYTSSAVAFKKCEMIYKQKMRKIYCELLQNQVINNLESCGMSLERQKTKRTGQLDLLQRKLNAVDSHLRKTQKLPATMFMHPQLLQHLMKQKTTHQITNEILLLTPKSILFNKNADALIYFSYLPIDDDKRYCLKIQPSNTQLTVLLIIDDQKKQSYSVNKSRGIVVDAKKWKKAQFSFTAKRTQKLSLAKVQMTTITVEHKVKIHGIPSQKKIVEQQFRQFMQNNSNNQKIQQIIQKRRRKSLSSSNSLRIIRAKTATTIPNSQKLESYGSARLFRNYSKFNESTGVTTNVTPVFLQSKIQSAQLKRDLISFQSSKSKFIRQLQNMGSQRANQIIENKKNYDIKKKQTLQSFSCLTVGFIFVLRVHKACIQHYKFKIAKIQTYLLCKRFIKNIVHANRSRIPLKIRNKLVLDDSLCLISAIHWQEALHKAETRIIDSIKSQMFKIDVLQIGNLSQIIISKCKIIQKQFRVTDQRYFKRFETLVLIIKGYKIQNKKQLQLCFRKYKQFCYTKSKRLRYGFMKYTKQIDEIIAQNKIGMEKKQVNIRPKFQFL